MNKKNKVLFVLVPLVVGIIGYVAYVEMNGSSSPEAMTAEEVDKIYVKPSATEEAYLSKLEMHESKTKIERKLENEKKSVADPTKFFSKAQGGESEEESVEINDPVEEVEKMEETVVEKPRVVYVPVEKVEEEPVIQSKPRRKRFASSSTSGSSNESSGAGGIDLKNQMTAVVHREVKVRTNDVVKLRTTNEITIDGTSIPENTFIDGIARVDSNSGRVFIMVQGFVANGKYVDKRMEVYSLNGGEGLEVNIDLSKEAGRSIVGDALSGQTRKVTIPGINTGTAANAAQNKVEEATATIPSGTKLYLR